MKHGMVRLDSVWGDVGGRRPVKLLVKKVRRSAGPGWTAFTISLLCNLKILETS